MELSCPISAERVNENVIRIIALIVALIAISCMFLDNYSAMVFLLIDFATRAFTSGKLSLLKQIALQIHRMLAVPKKMTDLAPKKFAATLGCAFCLVITIVYFLQFPTAALILTGTLVVFALFEGIFSVCVGCHIYSFANVLLKKK